MEISEYNLFNPYNATCLCIFKADLLVIDSQLMYSSLRKITSPCPCFPHLTIFLCIELRPHRVFLSYF